MSTTFISYNYFKKQGHKVRDCKRKLEKGYDMEKSGKFNHERKKRWCRYHQINCHSDKQCFQQMKKSEKIKMKVRKNSVAYTKARVVQIKNTFSESFKSKILSAEEWQ